MFCFLFVVVVFLFFDFFFVEVDFVVDIVVGVVCLYSLYVAAGYKAEQGTTPINCHCQNWRASYTQQLFLTQVRT